MLLEQVIENLFTIAFVNCIIIIFWSLDAKLLKSFGNTVSHRKVLIIFGGVKIKLTPFESAQET